MDNTYIYKQTGGTIMNYKIGLSLGISSVGWAVIEQDKQNNPINIVSFGVRSFDIAENPKDGVSPAKIRTEKRTIRRRLRRRKHRIERTKLLLEKYNIFTRNEVENLYANNNHNIYELRVKAIETEITNIELAKVLLAMVKKRGYKSSVKIAEEFQSEDGKVLLAAKKNQCLLENANYRTVGEMYLKDDKFKIHLPNGDTISKIRNTTKSYATVVFREELLNEVQLILDKQKSYNSLITNEFINEYITIFTSQREFDEGPALSSKYSGNIIKKMLRILQFRKKRNTSF